MLPVVPGPGLHHSLEKKKKKKGGGGVHHIVFYPWEGGKKRGKVKEEGRGECRSPILSVLLKKLACLVGWAQ